MIKWRYFFLHFPMIYSMMASFSEGLLLGEKVGLDPDVLVQVFGHFYVHEI